MPIWLVPGSLISAGVRSVLVRWPVEPEMGSGLGGRVHGVGPGVHTRGKSHRRSKPVSANSSTFMGRKAVIGDKSRKGVGFWVK